MRLGAALCCLLCLAIPALCGAAGLPALRVSENGRFLVKADGSPFFWLGDTAWELFHFLNLADSERYLQDRADKGFTVIQAVVLPELGLSVPNANGDLPLIDLDPTRPNEAYFAHVDAVVKAAARRGLYVGMLPCWGDKWNKKWGVDPEIFTPENAAVYGEFLGRRYRDQPVIWILGGDRPVQSERHLAIVRALAAGLRRGDGGRRLMTYHPSNSRSSGEWFHGDDWLSFNMTQSGHHERNKPNYELIARDYARTPAKPCLDGEPCYEQTAVGYKPRLGRFEERDVRQAAYWAVFAGAHGHTYGALGVFEFHQPPRPDKFGAPRPWQEALAYPGAGQMRHLRALMESRPFLTRVPDQGLVVPVTGEPHVQATRDAAGSYAMLYIPGPGQTVTVESGRLSGKRLKAWWYDPRTGRATAIEGSFPVGGSLSFTSPGDGPDWVLVLDDEARRYPPPGTAPVRR